MNKEAVKVRSLALDDHELGRTLLHEYVEATAIEIGVTFEQLVKIIPDYYDFPGAYFPGGDFLIAFVGDKSAGCVGITPGGGELCEMNRLWVRPDFRTLGVGRSLVEASLGRAAELGYTRMGLDVLAGRVGAIDLYRKMGFRDCEPFHEYEYELVGLVRGL